MSEGRRWLRGATEAQTYADTEECGGGRNEAAVALPYFPSRLTSPLVPRP